MFFILICLLPAPAVANAQGNTATDEYAPAREILQGLNKVVTENGVQDTFVATLGGARQVVTVRGSGRDNPILLYIHGGPGAAESPFAWAFERPWEDFFTVVQWDQRGAGRSYLLNDPKALAPRMTLDRLRDDAIELFDWLRRRYGKRKVFLLGHSFGSVIGWWSPPSGLTCFMPISAWASISIPKPARRRALPGHSIRPGATVTRKRLAVLIRRDGELGLATVA